MPEVTQRVKQKSRNSEPGSMPPHPHSWWPHYMGSHSTGLTPKKLQVSNWLMSSFPSKTLQIQGQFPSSSSFQDGASKWPSQESREISRTDICINWQKIGTPLIPALPTPTPYVCQAEEPHPGRKRQFGRSELSPSHPTWQCHLLQILGLSSGQMRFASSFQVPFFLPSGWTVRNG